MIISYDELNDVFCIYINYRRYNKFSTDDEEAEKIFVLRDDLTNEIVGVKILEFNKNRRRNIKWLAGVHLAHCVCRLEKGHDISDLQRKLP